MLHRFHIGSLTALPRLWAELLYRLTPGNETLSQCYYLQGVQVRHQAGLDRYPEALNRLKRFNLAQYFIFIFPATWPGSSKRSQSFQHDVDLVIEVPEMGKNCTDGKA